MTMNLSRRHLLAGSSAGLGLAALAPGLKVAFAADAAPAKDVLIVLFQRGACDWLQMLAPAGDPNYIAARPTIRVPATGANAGIGLSSLGGTDFYLSASAPELKTLYDSGKIAFVHAVGMPTTDRSHFICQDMMEKGIADNETKQNSGWLARHIASGGGASAELATISTASTNPAALLGEPSAVAITDASNFNISGGSSTGNIIRAMNTGVSAYKNVANAALDAVDAVQQGLRTLTDTSSTAGYTTGALSQPLRSLAKLIKMNVGVSVATVDFGSWDMHNGLVGEFNQRTIEFSRALAAFWKDMEGYHDRITLVTMTEFGRRLQENTSQGTDHGSASGMMILGGNVKGGKIYGTWPGLAPSQLTTGDLTVTTDYRQVLAEILTVRHAEKNLAAVFPTLKYSPLGIF
ncbi:MAG: DUF1501 domain-containing protein [Rhodospirillaceae bacterium]|nr:DUF1501 domain-containing protein [Rhodospirillaceae bacterium]